MTGWLDSHCHILSEEFREDLPEVLARAKEVPLNKMLVICCSREEAMQAPELKKQNPDLIDIAAGIHPEDADTYTKEDLDFLESHLATHPFSALGEIGLDYHWVQDNKERQKELFVSQLEMADRLDLPVLIHMRDATQDCYDILKSHTPKRGGIMHCYPGSYEMAMEFIKLGFTISLAGPVTFKNAREPKDVAARIPLERILIETDCPYMTPVPFRGKRNEPMYVKYTGQIVADLRGIREEELQKALWENYRRLFDRKEEEMP